MHPLSTRRWLRLLSGLALFLILAGCAGSPDPGIQPVQSPNDDRDYRLLTLDNDLQVLLVSDPNNPKAAASLDVYVGSGDNPEGRGGLAHFLEHMLFLGTDKYPDSAEYEAFVTEHGGNRNAFTSLEHTNYFFDVDAPYLPEALDRFAQFFISPRFDAEYVDREKNAVEAEYQMGLKSDARRGLDVLQEVMNPAHPFSQFAVGSLESLADRPGSSIRDELLAFYDRFYSANLMRLVVLGPQSLDELESLVVPMFSPVPNQEYTQSEIEAPLFVEGTLPALVKVQPQATSRELQILFPLPDYREHYDVKPMSYIGNLVGHEGQGSVLSQLKAEGLAESLAAGAGLGWRGGSLFGITLTLTEKGVAEYERALQLIFAYLDMLRDLGPREWLYDEQARLADLSFRFREEGDPMSYVTSLSGSMLYHAPEDILRGPYIMRNYRPQMIADALSAMVPENALVILQDQGVETDRVSEHYEVPYSLRSVGGEQLAAWQGDVATGVLALPEPNPFIAENVDLVALSPENPPHPELALEEGRERIWFKQDEQFRVPRGAMYINFRSPLVGQSPGQSAAAVLYTALLRDRVNEFTYPALLAGLNFSFYKHAQGISMRISGYDDKQFVLLDDLLAVIRDPGFEEQRFDNIRADIIRSLENAVAKRPSSQVMDDLREALLHGQWGEQVLIDALSAMQLRDLEQYIQAFWDSATAEALLYGNYTTATVHKLSGRLDLVVPDSPAPALPPLRVTRLQAGERGLYPVDVPHDDSVLAWYLQGDGDSWEDRAATALTAQVMKSGFFQELRTEQQLGYVVSAFSWAQLDVPGLVMLIQSPVADSAALADAMAAYLGTVPDSLDEAQFIRHRQALVNDILRPDKNLWERAEFYWQSIAKKQYDFDGRVSLASAVEELTLARWRDYFQRVFLAQPHSLQVAAPGRWRVLPADVPDRYESAEQVKAENGFYVID